MRTTSRRRRHSPRQPPPTPKKPQDDDDVVGAAVDTRRMIPKDFHSSDTLDAFRAYFVNPYPHIDHHSHDLIKKYLFKYTLACQLVGFSSCTYLLAC
jgi:hypothetical protein